MKSEGLTLIELLVVMGIIAIAFTVLATGAITNLRGTATTRDQTAVKGVAVQEMERLANKALYVDTSTTTYSYAFAWYYENCTTATLPADCKGQDTAKGLTWEIRSEKDVGATQAEKFASEGQILISVLATGQNNARYSIVKRISCYDVYPSPSTTAPAPCPAPTSPTPAGGGA